MLRRAAGVGLAGAGLALVLASPAWAENVQAGEFCAQSRAGTTTTASNGSTVRCAPTSSEARLRWRTVSSSSTSSPGSSTSEAGLRNSAGGSTGTPSSVSTGTGGLADRTNSPAGWAVGAVGLLVVGASTTSLIRRRNG